MGAERLYRTVGTYAGEHRVSYRHRRDIILHEFYTIVHNKDAHGKKGSIIAIVKGVFPQDVSSVLLQIPEELRRRVATVTMDLSDCMRSIVRTAFPGATVVRDCFYVMKRAGEGVEELRLRFKHDAVKDVNRQKAEFKKYLERLAKQRRQYRERRKKQGKKPCKGKRRGLKPKRMNTQFEPARLQNRETLVEILTRCRTQLAKSREKWTDKEEARAKILFETYKKMKEAYDLVNDLRSIFKNKKLTKKTARLKFDEWYEKVAKSTLREIKSVKYTVKHYEDEILNYFNNWETNASAESLNSKIKYFRSSLRGVRDIPLFFYRLMMVFG